MVHPDVGQKPPPDKNHPDKNHPDKNPPGHNPSHTKIKRTKTPFYILFDSSKHYFKNVTLLYPPVVVNEKLVFKLFPLVVHMSPLWWGLHLLTFLCPWYPWILCKGPTWPRKKWHLFYFFYFNSKGSYHIASIFDM